MMEKAELPPDLRQSVGYAFKLTLVHNFLPIGYLLIITVLLFWALYKPTRKKLLAIIGFSALLFNFEYQKHFLGPLKKQTLDSLTTVNPHYRFQWLIDRFLTKGLPFFLYSLVTISFMAIAISLLIHRNKK